jgi:hypothetical protein
MRFGSGIESGRNTSKGVCGRAACGLVDTVGSWMLLTRVDDSAAGSARFFRPDTRGPGEVTGVVGNSCTEGMGGTLTGSSREGIGPVRSSCESAAGGSRNRLAGGWGPLGDSAGSSRGCRTGAREPFVGAKVQFSWESVASDTVTRTVRPRNAVLFWQQDNPPIPLSLPAERVWM